MRSVLKSALCLALTLVLLLSSGLAACADQPGNPLVEPYEITEYVELPDETINILLLGIDFGTSGYWGSGYKKDITDCHTDAVMVITVNLDKKRIDFVSLPRDTVTYVPGVRGIYKLNAAINCADTLREGLEKTKNAAEWLLGGIRIDNYFAVDMSTMIMIGDAIGGIDFDLEMTYTGHSGKTYYSGMQHLDGTGITDYLRARTNATVNYTDIGRTNRQRQIMLAIYEKLRDDEDMLWNVLNTAIEMPDGFYTDITTAVLLRYAVLLSSILNIDGADIGMHVFTGPYRGTLEWNFTFTDQENRLSVIEEVYGVAAEPIPYVSSQYAQWLLDTGFSSVHYISVARELLNDLYATNAGGMTAEQLAACQAFELAFRDAVSTFETAADTLSADDTRAMEEARKTLYDAGNACAEAIGYSGTLAWAHNRSYWYDDTYINEYQVDWR